MKVLIADGVPEGREHLERILAEWGYSVVVIGSPVDYDKLRAILKADDADLILPPGTTAAEAERQLIMKTLERTGNNKAEAARQLGLDVKTIRNKLRTYGTRQTQKAV